MSINLSQVSVQFFNRHRPAHPLSHPKLDNSRASSFRAGHFFCNPSLSYGLPAFIYPGVPTAAADQAIARGAAVHASTAWPQFEAPLMHFAGHISARLELVL